MGRPKRARAEEKAAAPSKKSKTSKNEKTASKEAPKESQKAEPVAKPAATTTASITSAPHKLKILSWNINGIRAWMQKDGLSVFASQQPDMVCLQETKCSEDKMPEGAEVPGYKSYYMSAKKPGYSGVALYSKTEPLNVTYGFGDAMHDAEGRCITAEYNDFFLVTAYVPNAGRGLVTMDKRMDWDPKFLAHLQALDAKKPVVMCGDLNVAHQEIDLANPKSNRKNAGFTPEERAGFDTLLEGGFFDSYRSLYPDTAKAYTFWTYMSNARAKNVGWRIDYFVLSTRLKERLLDNVMLGDVMGSDHCPIVLTLK